MNDTHIHSDGAEPTDTNEVPKRSRIRRLARAMDDKRNIILVVETVIIVGAIATPKIRHEVALYRKLQLDATEAKLAVFALAGKLLVDDEAQAVVVEAVETATT